MTEKSTRSFPAPGGAWAASFHIHSDMPEGELICVDSEDGRVLTLSREGEQLRLTLFTRWDGASGRFQPGQTLSFALEAPFATGSWRIEWLGYAARLYADGALADEEWPLGTLPGGEWHAECGAGTMELSLYTPDADAESAESSFDGPMQYFVPEGHNAGAGDCMPFSRDGRYCLYYLFDRRGHRSKAGLGAHQWAQISSADLKHWTVHPMAVGITEQWEGSICTGSLIQKDGKTFAFYAVRASDGSPARLTCAVSDDGVRFEKTGLSFALTDPYEPVSARDPMVFSGADGRYHMLVTTSLASGGRYGGCLAHLTSDNLSSWTQHEPFLVPGYADQPECSDYFEWNGWYYLVFSNFATARYRISRKPFGPWTKPECDVLDTAEDQVAKTAEFNGRRLSTGFLARYPRGYAGCAVTHELFQREDGTLGVRFVEEILPAVIGRVDVPTSRLDAPQGRAGVTWYIGAPRFRVRAHLSPSGDRPIYGFSMRFGEREYRLDFDPARKTVQVLRPDQYFSGGETRNQLLGVEGLNNPLSVDMIVYRDVLDVALSNGRALTMRMEVEPGDCELSLYAMWGGLSASAASLEILQ